MPAERAPRFAALRVADAHKRFGEIVALAGASLTLAQGEWIGLLGPNGAGKSTLMHAVAGLLRLDGGGIEIFGQSIADGGRPVAPREGASGVGFVPQEIALYPLLTTAENLSVFGRLHGLGGGELRRRVVWALEWTGLASRARALAGELSGGMQRRLNIACGVLHEPRLVLLDEPTVGVDPQGRQRIWEMLGELRERGTALVQSTHGLSDIEPLCDRMLIMDHGRIIASGTVDELIAETLGGAAVLQLTFDRPAAGLLPQNGFEIAGNTLCGALRDVAVELPAVLAKTRAAGLDVRSVRVDRPSLEAVFTHLTGRELRE